MVTGVVTVMSTGPVPAGDTAVIEVAELTVKLAAALAPKSTAVAPVKLAPVIVTDVPPGSGPVLGLTPATLGAGGPKDRLCDPPVAMPATWPSPLTVTGTGLLRLRLLPSCPSGL